MWLVITNDHSTTRPRARERAPRVAATSVAPPLAEAMRRVYEGESISSLFAEFAGDTARA